MNAALPSHPDDWWWLAARIISRRRPGWHRLRIYYGGLHTVSADGLGEDDHYQVVLWPAPASEPKTLKHANPPAQDQL